MNKLKTLLLTLLLTTSFSTLADSHLDFTLSAFCYKQPNVQDRGGVYYFPNKEIGITKSSLCIYKDSYGQYASKGKLIDGKKDGKWTYWHKNGQEYMKGNYIRNNEDGQWTYRQNENNNVIEESNFNNGRCIGGYCLYGTNVLTLDELLAWANREDYDDLKSNYINQIVARIKSYWRYQGAEDNWSCQVYVLQDINGTVRSVKVWSCEIDDSAKALSFKDSIERAVYKSSPLPTAPDESVFDREIFFDFRVN